MCVWIRTAESIQWCTYRVVGSLFLERVDYPSPSSCGRSSSFIKFGTSMGGVILLILLRFHGFSFLFTHRRHYLLISVLVLCLIVFLFLFLDGSCSFMAPALRYRDSVADVSVSRARHPRVSCCLHFDTLFVSLSPAKRNFL